MIIAFIQTKGGTSKTTLSRCLPYSRVFQKAFKRISLVELDIQGSLYAWNQYRIKEKRKNQNVKFFSLANVEKDKLQSSLIEIANISDAIILDVPGESTSKFATKLAMSLSTLTLLPMRSSTDDEQSFIDNVYPDIKQSQNNSPEKKDSFYILPTFVHHRSKPENIKKYFSTVMPKTIGCLDVFMSYRAVYENFSRDGMTLQEYARLVKGNAKFSLQAKKALKEIDLIAEHILNLKDI